MSGETCVNGVCMCGTSLSCAGQATGSYCDAANNICKCSSSVSACTGSDVDTCVNNAACHCGTTGAACSGSSAVCTNGACGMDNN